VVVKGIFDGVADLGVGGRAQPGAGFEDGGKADVRVRIGGELGQGIDRR
jgi:hypothetical protein